MRGAGTRSQDPLPRQGAQIESARALASDVLGESMAGQSPELLRIAEEESLGDRPSVSMDRVAFEIVSGGRAGLASAQQIGRSARDGEGTELEAEISRGERESNEPTAIVDPARDVDLHQIVFQQTSHEPRRFGAAIVKPVRAGVEAEFQLRTIGGGTVGEGARVASDLLARLQDPEREAALAREMAGREPGGSAAEDQQLRNALPRRCAVVRAHGCRVAIRGTPTIRASLTRVSLARTSFPRTPVARTSRARPSLTRTPITSLMWGGRPRRRIRRRSALRKSASRIARRALRTRSRAVRG